MYIRTYVDQSCSSGEINQYALVMGPSGHVFSSLTPNLMVATIFNISMEMCFVECHIELQQQNGNNIYGKKQAKLKLIYRELSLHVWKQDNYTDKGEEGNGLCIRKITVS